MAHAQASVDALRERFPAPLVADLAFGAAALPADGLRRLGPRP
jgi:hypothetical protein